MEFILRGLRHLYSDPPKYEPVSASELPCDDPHGPRHNVLLRRLCAASEVFIAEFPHGVVNDDNGRARYYDFLLLLREYITAYNATQFGAIFPRRLADANVVTLVVSLLDMWPVLDVCPRLLIVQHADSPKQSVVVWQLADPVPYEA